MRFGFLILPVILGLTGSFVEANPGRALGGYEADDESPRLWDQVYTVPQRPVLDGINKRSPVRSGQKLVTKYFRKRIPRSTDYSWGIPAVQPSVLHREFIEKKSTGWTEWLYTYSDGRKGTVLTSPRSRLEKK